MNASRPVSRTVLGIVRASAALATLVLATGASAQVDPSDPLPGAIYEQPRRLPGAYVNPPRPLAHVEVRDIAVHGRVDAPAMRRVILGRYAVLRRCVEGRLAVTDPVRAVVMVSPGGRVAMTELDGVDARVRSCLSRTLNALRLPAGSAFGRVEVVLRPIRPQPGRPVEVGQNRCGSSPAGCRSTGCGEGLVCDTRVRCVPSSCGCDPRTGQWVCTADCGGGVCVHPGSRSAPGV